MPRSPMEDFEAVHPAAEKSPERAEDALAMAGDLVERWAPPPDPEPADYDARARRCERMVAAYIFDTQAYKPGVSLSGMSLSYDVQGQALKGIVRDAMGPYYRGRVLRTYPLERG